MNVADAVVLSIVIAICTLIVRGMLRDTIRTCDEGSCGGNCGSCGHACSAPRLRLNKAQLEQLKALDEKGHVA